MVKHGIFCCTTMVLMFFEIGLTLGLDLDKLEDVSVSRDKMIDVGLANGTEIELEDPLKLELTGALKKSQVKKRPGVSVPDSPSIEDMGSLNISESSVMSKTTLNISISNNNSSKLKSFMVDEKNVSPSFGTVKLKDLISSHNANLTNVPIIKLDNEEPSSIESSERSFIEDDSLELKKNSDENKVNNGSKFVSTEYADRKASKKLKEKDNKYLTKSEMMFSGNTGMNDFIETEVSKNDTTINSTTLSHRPILLLHDGSTTDNFTSNLNNFTSTPRTLKVLSKPSTATMGEIGKMSSGNVVLISSIIGIICLCALIGIIAYKRIYAYWYRRHYSRVDFLIDGLYEM